MKRLRAAVAAIILAALWLTACSSGTPSQTQNGGDAAVDHSNQEYIFVSSMGNLEYFNAHKFGWKWAGEVLGVRTSYVGPAENDVNAQAAAFEQAIAKQPAGIAVFAADPVLGPQINNAVAAGIPVVTVIGDLPDSDRIAYVGSSQFDLGYFGGMRLGEELGGEGKVAILSVVGGAQWDERAEGYEAAFDNFPGIEMVQVGDTKADTVTSVNVAKSIMQRFPDLAAFVATDSTGGIGAATAVREADKAGEIKIISMDRNSDVLGMIQEGVVTGTIAQEDPGISFWALQTLFNAVNYPSPLVTDPEAAGVTTGPNVVQMHSNYIDQNNVQYFLDQNAAYQG